MQTYPTGYAESHHIAEQIFREILPRHGMAVREEQIALCHEVLDAFVGGIFWVAVVPENFFSRRARCFRLIFHVFYLFSVSASAKGFLLKGK